MRRAILCWSLLAAMGSSCEEGSQLPAPPVSFSSFPQGKAENLQRILGSELTLTSERDTQHVRVAYTPQTQLNLLTAAETGDTLLLARVIRHRRLFYLVEQVSDSRYAVHAARIRPRFVQGLNTNWEQMVYLDNATQRGQYGHLIQARHPEQGRQLLAFDLQTLRPFFRTVLDSLPRYTISHHEVASAGKQRNNQLPISSSPDSAERTSLYPNPATDYVTLTFAASGGWKAQVFTLSGHLVQTQQARDSVLVLSLTQLSPGGYLVKLTENETGHTTTKRLLVQR
jgi:hypothetical protein